MSQKFTFRVAFIFRIYSFIKKLCWLPCPTGKKVVRHADYGKLFKEKEALILAPHLIPVSVKHSERIYVVPSAILGTSIVNTAAVCYFPKKTLHDLCRTVIPTHLHHVATKKKPRSESFERFTMFIAKLLTMAKSDDCSFVINGSESEYAISKW